MIMRTNEWIPRRSFQQFSSTSSLVVNLPTKEVFCSFICISVPSKKRGIGALAANRLLYYAVPVARQYNDSHCSRNYQNICLKNVLES